MNLKKLSKNRYPLIPRCQLCLILGGLMLLMGCQHTMGYYWTENWINPDNDNLCDGGDSDSSDETGDQEGSSFWGGVGGKGKSSNCKSCENLENSKMKAAAEKLKIAKNKKVQAEVPFGMPVWRVSEPYVNLWLDDYPLSYQPSRGPEIAFRLSYKDDSGTQGDFSRFDTNVFCVGWSWHCSWQAYLETNTVTSEVWLFTSEGGVFQYTVGADIEYNTQTSLQWTNNQFVVSYPSGAKDYYALGTMATNRFDEELQRYFRTRREDPAGNAIRFEYTTNTYVRLDKVIDADNKTNTFTYYGTTNLFSSLIRTVTDPYGNQITLQYDGTLGTLTNITDEAGISTGIGYDAENNITNLTTPYGTTEFAFLLTSSTRALKVTEPDGGKHLFLARSTFDSALVPDSYTSQVPSTTNTPYFSIPNTFNNGQMNNYNSFYWNPRQYEALGQAVRDALATNGVSFFDSMTNTDFFKGRLSHWLQNVSFGNTLSMLREPSPDSAGAIEGQTTWFDYEGKTGSDNEIEGTMKLPRFIARKLPNGESQFVHFERNSLGNPTKMVETYTDAGNGAVKARTNIFTYSSDGIDLLTVTNSSSVRVAAYGYDTNHQVLTATNAVSEVTTYTYNTNHQVTSIKTPAGLTTTNIYFTSGSFTNWLDKTIDLEINRTNSFTYINGLVYSRTDERGLTVTNSWDSLQRLRKITYPDGTYSTNVYDKLDLVRVVDRLGNTNRFEYDSMRRRTRYIDALNRTNTYSYCTCGVLESITDPLGNLTQFSYDNQSRLTSTVYPDSTSVTKRYNLAGQLTNMINSAGVSMTNWFNNQGLMVASSNAFGRVFKVVYDIESNLTSLTDGNGVTITSTFDNLHRLLTQTYPDSGVESFGYSTNGLTTYTNQLNQVTRYVYDAGRRKTYETNANSEVTQFTYNAAGDLLTLVDGKSQSTSWNYDEYGLVTNKVDTASNVLFVYKYDSNNRLTNRLDALGHQTKYFYDVVGNVTNIDYNSSTDIQLRFDALNRLTNMVDATGTTVYSYTNLHLLSQDGPWASDTVSYTYDNGRRRSGLTLLEPNASAWTQSYGYDAASRMTNITSPAGAFTYAYDAARKLQVNKLTLPNTSFITNTFDSVARLTGTYLKNSGNTNLNSHTYGYNARNQRTQQVFTAANYVDYTYDNIGQLKTANGKESGGTTNRLQEQLSYVYDTAGNLNLRTNNALVQAFNVNNLNELTTTTNSGMLTVAGTTTSAATNVTVNTSNATVYLDNTFAKDGFTVTNGNNTYKAIGKDSYGRSDTNSITVNLPATNTYAYDLNGNLTSDGTRGFDYDDENQLIRVTATNAWKSEFTYDGTRRRRIRKEYNWSGSWVQTNEVRYVYDGNLVIQERDANNLPTVSYTRGRDLGGKRERTGGIGGLLARTDNGSQTVAFYHCDANGNITALQNLQQMVVARYLYDPFGNILSQSGPLADSNLYRFSSKEYHQNSGLIYYLYRFYDPNLQRWLNRDPLGERGGINLYHIAFNDTIDYVDPNGEFCVPCVYIAIGLIFWIDFRHEPEPEPVFQIDWHQPPQPPSEEEERQAKMEAVIQELLANTDKMKTPCPQNQSPFLMPSPWNHNPHVHEPELTIPDPPIRVQPPYYSPGKEPPLPPQPPRRPPRAIWPFEGGRSRGGRASVDPKTFQTLHRNALERCSVLDCLDS